MPCVLHLVVELSLTVIQLFATVTLIQQDHTKRLVNVSQSAAEARVMLVDAVSRLFVTTPMVT